MLVVENMVAAKLIIAGALVAITEGKLRIAFFGLSADMASVVGEVCRDHLMILKLLSMLRTLVASLKQVQSLSPIEYQIVGDGRDRHGFSAEAAHDEHEGQIEPVHIGQILRFHRQDEEQQELLVRILPGKGQEQRQIQEHRGHRGSCGKACGDKDDHTDQVVQIEMERSPRPLQSLPDNVVEIEGDGCKGNVEARWDKEEGQQSPDLPLQHQLWVEHQLVIKSRVQIDGEERDPVQDDDVFHQTFYVEFSIFLL